jgi:tRNA dimethylallyltransferase
MEDSQSMRKEHEKLPKLVVILGPTTSGKTAWSVRLAKKFGGMVISADSRQIYKKMDIGTGKALGEWRREGLRMTHRIEDVPHHMVDFLDPGKTFSVVDFRDKAVKHIKLAQKNKLLPIVSGGTGLYVSVLVDNYNIPRVAPNKKLRKSLAEKSKEDLLQLLGQMDKEAAKTIDPDNKRRLIRALEVCIFTGEPFSSQKTKGHPLFDALQIGIDVSRGELDKRIDARVDQMIKMGLVKEIELLLKQKYSWELPSMSNVGYGQFQGYFENQCTLDEAIERLKRDTRRYARRQISWFKRDKRIKWLRNYEEAEGVVQEFLDSQITIPKS